MVPNKSCHIWMSHVSHANVSKRYHVTPHDTRTSSRKCYWVMVRKKKCHVWINHVSHIHDLGGGNVLHTWRHMIFAAQVILGHDSGKKMSHMNESCLAYTRVKKISGRTAHHFSVCFSHDLEKSFHIWISHVSHIDRWIQVHLVQHTAWAPWRQYVWVMILEKKYHIWMSHVSRIDTSIQVRIVQHTAGAPWCKYVWVMILEKKNCIWMSHVSRMDGLIQFDITDKATRAPSGTCYWVMVPDKWCHVWMSQVSKENESISYHVTRKATWAPLGTCHEVATIRNSLK